MLQIIVAGKKIAEHTDYLAAHRQARELSIQNPDVPVYVQDGGYRSVYRNGFAL